FPPQSWGVSTHKGGRVFVHVLKPDAAILLPDIGRSIKSATMFDNGSRVRYQLAPFGATVVKMPEQKPDEYDTIIVVELD
ncbi:MAG: alpha-L-fucosidase, partial [Gemmatimonadota bacterium]|nr:alpha-L-fucosidase [Gemmatimonadota bacterium]